ncbi:MAG: aspartate kinase [Ekhidna sp.]
MQIFKFGGASVKDASGVRNLDQIVSDLGNNKLVVVVSAMGKMTNKLEELIDLSQEGKNYDAILNEVFEFHHTIANDLLGELPKRYLEFENSLKECLIKSSTYDFMRAYDMIIPHGELMSTSIIQAFLNKSKSTTWVDARTLIRTDQYFTEANVDWVVTEKQITKQLRPVVEESIVVTQGFIGSDVEGNSTTLGREGSDYSGAILANCLNASDFTVWKDVPGILNADPRLLDNTEQFNQLSYREVTEMTYYGAQIIHPKTLKPLAQKDIPLVVRSFENRDLKGTTISTNNSIKQMPCYVFKGNQLLITAQVKDHSFMEEKKLSLILNVLDLLNIKINLMQNSALTFSFCIDNKEFKAKRIMELLNRDFLLSSETGLNLATIKNYRDDSFSQLPVNRSVILEQKTMDNYQVVYK